MRHPMSINTHVSSTQHMSYHVHKYSCLLYRTHVIPCPHEKKIESVAKSFLAGLRHRSLTIGDVSQRNYYTPTDHENGSAVYTQDDSDMSAPSIVSSFNFTLSILNLLMSYFGINKSLSPKVIESDIEPAGVVTQLNSRTLDDRCSFSLVYSQVSIIRETYRAPTLWLDSYDWLRRPSRSKAILMCHYPTNEFQNAKAVRRLFERL